MFYRFISFNQVLLLLISVSSSAGQILKALYDDGSVISFSIASSNDPVVYHTIPDSDGTETPSLPGFCKSPLLHSCFRAQNKNDTEFYSPAVNARDAFVLERVLEHGNEISLRKSAVSFRCNLNDFVISSGNLLVACRPIGSNDACTYLFNGQCHNFPPQNIENFVSDPVAFTVPVTNFVDNSGGGKIVSVVRSRGLKLIVFSTSHRLRLYDIPNDCQAPLKLSRQESTILLACVNATQYMVNITELPAKFFYIDSAAHGPLLALSDKGYALFSSPPQLTLQNITSGYAVTISINIRQGSIVYADFTSDGNYAFVVTNVTAIFIHITEALAGLSSHNDQSQNFYFFPIQICFTCPSVQFLNTTMAVISARDGDRYFTTLLFLSLSQWPPYLFLNKTLQGFPKQYWYIAAGSSAEIVLPTTTDKMTLHSSTNTVIKSKETPTTTNSPSNSDSHDDSTGTIIAVILFPIIGCLVIFGFIVVICNCKKTQRCNTNPRPGEAPTLHLEPVQEQNGSSRHSWPAKLQSVSIGLMHDARQRKPTQATPNKGTAKMVSATSISVINQAYMTGEQEPHYPTQAEPDSQQVHQ